MTEEQTTASEDQDAQPPATEEATPVSPHTSPWRSLIVAVLPHLFTALISIGLALAIQRALPQPEPTFLPPTRPTAAPTALQPTTLAPTAGAAQPEPDERVLSQEILDLQVRIDELWSGVYIARAAGQLADAESALRTNDTVEVERVLVAVDASLARAYERSGDLNKGPISEFRSQISQIRDDLYVRPEGLDQKLYLLRQRMLSLVEEP